MKEVNEGETDKPLLGPSCYHEKLMSEWPQRTSWIGLKRDLTASQLRSSINLNPALTFISVLIFFLFIYTLFNYQSDVESLHSIFGTARWLILTAKGRVSYDEVEERIYHPRGLEIRGLKYPLVHLLNTNPPTCDKVFTEWTQTASRAQVDNVPRSKIPDSELNAYLFDGYSFLWSYYQNGKHNSGKESKPFQWSREFIEELKTRNPRTYVTYYNEGMSLFHAMAHFKKNISGKEGLVVGSMKPWAETIALVHGASRVTTAEYQRINISHPQMTYVHPFEMAKNWKDHVKRYDFAVSFSSIEHSGLGRYGDPYDPIGDFREVDKIRCELKTGGLFFLGLPCGQDGIAYNAHRMYGRIRLPILFEGFDLLAVFKRDNSHLFTISRSDFEGRLQRQLCFVLRKL